jgi:hypothetical protein
MYSETWYFCEICGYCYRTAAEAEACEAQGRPVQPPPGILRVCSFYGRDMAFATSRHCVPKPRSHNVRDSYWACRDNGLGDTLGDETCGSVNGWHPEPFDEVWLTLPPMRRLVGWLLSQGIQPLGWIDGRPQPIDDLLVKHGLSTAVLKQ